MDFKVVEEMPRFPGCEHIEKEKERKKCSEKALLRFIYENITYPIFARENGIKGSVVVQFVVERDGLVTNAKIVQDIGGGCGEATLQVVNMMPKWIPGKQNGKPVKVHFNLPVKFQLEGEEEKKWWEKIWPFK